MPKGIKKFFRKNFKFGFSGLKGNKCNFNANSNKFENVGNDSDCVSSNERMSEKVSSVFNEPGNMPSDDDIDESKSKLSTGSDNLYQDISTKLDGVIECVFEGKDSLEFGIDGLSFKFENILNQEETQYEMNLNAKLQREDISSIPSSLELNSSEETNYYDAPPLEEIDMPKVNSTSIFEITTKDEDFSKRRNLLRSPEPFILQHLMTQKRYFSSAEAIANHSQEFQYDKYDSHHLVSPLFLQHRESNIRRSMSDSCLFLTNAQVLRDSLCVNDSVMQSIIETPLIGRYESPVIFEKPYEIPQRKRVAFKTATKIFSFLLLVSNICHLSVLLCGLLFSPPSLKLNHCDVLAVQVPIKNFCFLTIACIDSFASLYEIMLKRVFKRSEFRRFYLLSRFIFRISLIALSTYSLKVDKDILLPLAILLTTTATVIFSDNCIC